ncbi:UNVERIFIED_CONTAM: hypothetical protein RMT77_012873 [Armadillidium vulgare]
MEPTTVAYLIQEETPQLIILPQNSEDADNNKSSNTFNTNDCCMTTFFKCFQSKILSIFKPLSEMSDSSSSCSENSEEVDDCCNCCSVCCCCVVYDSLLTDSLDRIW